MRERFLIAAAVILAASVSVQAEPPELVRYQARLTDDAGVALTGTHDLVFEIFDSASDGSSEWIEGPRSLELQSGTLDVLLGEVTPLPSSVFTSADRWLEISVDGNVLSPRQRLSSLPYAHASGRLGDKTLAEVLAASVTSLDEAYDRGSPGGGRSITADAGAVRIDGTDGLTVAGRVGIGTTNPNPSKDLHVVDAGDVSEASLLLTTYCDDPVYESTIELVKSDTDTQGTLSPTQDGDSLGRIIWRGTAVPPMQPRAASISVAQDEEPGASYVKGRLVFSTADHATNKERMRITSDGFVGIGTTDPLEMLSVAGVVESTTGGFKFPDGTTQTTAASPTIYAYGTSTTTYSLENPGDVKISYGEVVFTDDGTQSVLSLPFTSAGSYQVTITYRDTTYRGNSPAVEKDSGSQFTIRNPGGAVTIMWIAIGT